MLCVPSAAHSSVIISGSGFLFHHANTWLIYSDLIWSKGKIFSLSRQKGSARSQAVVIYRQKVTKSSICWITNDRVHVLDRHMFSSLPWVGSQLTFTWNRKAWIPLRQVRPSLLAHPVLATGHSSWQNTLKSWSCSGPWLLQPTGKWKVQF